MRKFRYAPFAQTFKSAAPGRRPPAPPRRQRAVQLSESVVCCMSARESSLCMYLLPLTRAVPLAQTLRWPPQRRTSKTRQLQRMRFVLWKTT